MGLYLAYDAAHKPPGDSGPAARPRLLIAVRHEDAAFARHIIGQEFDFVICHSFQEARDQLDKGVHLVTCGVHFDNGRVFDLLRAVRENPGTAHLPFFILLGAGSRYSPAIIQGIRAAAKLLKVTAFTDLARFADKLGRDAAIDALRKGIRDAIEASPAAEASLTKVSG